MLANLPTLVNEINAAHPFTEGNGRTQRILLRLLGLQAGYAITLRHCRIRQRC